MSTAAPDSAGSAVAHQSVGLSNRDSGSNNPFADADAMMIVKVERSVSPQRFWSASFNGDPSRLNLKCVESLTDPNRVRGANDLHATN